MFNIITNIKYGIRNLIYGIRNLIYWFPIIWSDRYWDYCYLLRILKHKISSMEKLTRKNDITMSSKSNANKMKISINILDRLIEDDYILQYQDTTIFNRESNHFDKMKQQDLDYLLNIFRKNLFGWWD